jgi:hypothetical protein
MWLAIDVLVEGLYALVIDKEGFINYWRGIGNVEKNDEGGIKIKKAARRWGGLSYFIFTYLSTCGGSVKSSHQIARVSLVGVKANL